MRELIAAGKRPGLAVSLDFDIVDIADSASGCAITNDTGKVQRRRDVLTLGCQVAFTEAKPTDSAGRLLDSATNAPGGARGANVAGEGVSFRITDRTDTIGKCWANWRNVKRQIGKLGST